MVFIIHKLKTYVRVSVMGGAANFKILVSRPSRSRVPDCFKCFRELYTLVTVNGGLQVCFEYDVLVKILEACLKYYYSWSFGWLFFSATVEK